MVRLQPRAKFSVLLLVGVLASGNARSELFGTHAVLAVVLATRPFGGFPKARGISGRLNQLSRLVVSQ
jgi:hypothetical protein